jgi:hypothetical protein
MGFKQPDQENNPLTPEEDRAHEQALQKMRSELANGRTFKQASIVLAGMDENLRHLVVDDFLKITIAEEHFSRGRSLEQVAIFLGLAVAEIAAARDAMLEEVGEELARQYRQEIAGSAN